MKVGRQMVMMQQLTSLAKRRSTFRGEIIFHANPKWRIFSVDSFRFFVSGREYFFFQRFSYSNIIFFHTLKRREGDKCGCILLSTFFLQNSIEVQGPCDFSDLQTAVLPGGGDDVTVLVTGAGQQEPPGQGKVGSKLKSPLRLPDVDKVSLGPAVCHYRQLMLLLREGSI